MMKTQVAAGTVISAIYPMVSCELPLKFTTDSKLRDLHHRIIYDIIACNAVHL